MHQVIQKLQSFIYGSGPGIPKFGLWMHLEMAMCHVPFWGHCDIADFDL